MCFDFDAFPRLVWVVVIGFWRVEDFLFGGEPVCATSLCEFGVQFLINLNQMRDIAKGIVDLLVCQRTT